MNIGSQFAYEVLPANPNFSHSPWVSIHSVPSEVYDWTDEQGWVCEVDFKVFWGGSFVFLCPTKAAMFKLRWG